MHRTLSLIHGFGLIPSFASGDSVALLKWCRTAWEGGCRIIELDGTQITRIVLASFAGNCRIWPSECEA